MESLVRTSVDSELEIGWWTQLAVLELSGSRIAERPDHVIVRTPSNPTYHWGNFILVTDGRRVDDAARWVQEFSIAFPAASWVAVGLTGMPDDAAGWESRGLTLETEEVLTSPRPARRSPLDERYHVRTLSGADWGETVALAVAESARSDGHNRDTHERLERARTASIRSLAERNLAACFGAFDGEALVAYLGVVRCGRIARYQNVLTDEAHRRRGLASHLLGVAGQWAAENGCRQWVILTESTNPARFVYRQAGFTVHRTNVQAYKRDREAFRTHDRRTRIPPSS
jgi:GNAT superfamily N-acetyltransferase